MEVVNDVGESEKAAEERYEERDQKRMCFFMEVEETRRIAYAEEEETCCQAERLHEHIMLLSITIHFIYWTAIIIKHTNCLLPIKILSIPT